MAFSFSRLIIPESDIFIYKKALDFINENNMQVKRHGTAACTGEIDEQKVWLGFRKGVPVWRCSCVQNTDEKIKRPCFHVLAISLVWDRGRNVPDPSQADVEFLLKNT